MACKPVCKLCDHLVLSQSVTFTGGNLVINLPVGAYNNGEKYCTMKYTTANKETKIIVNAPWVKEHVVFKDKSLIGADKAYRQMMTFLCGYTVAGKNKHDDVPDGMAQLALYAQSLQGGAAEVKRRPY